MAAKEHSTRKVVSALLIIYMVKGIKNSSQPFKTFLVTFNISPSKILTLKHAQQKQKVCNLTLFKTPRTQDVLGMSYVRPDYILCPIVDWVC